MKEVFFNADGRLDISTSVKNHPSYTRIMEDKYVTSEELDEQYQLIKSLFRKMEDTFTEEQKCLVKQLMVEGKVYEVVRKHFNHQIESNGDFVI